MLLAACLAAAPVAVLAVRRYFADLFGPGTWGTGGNMVAWVICGVIAFGWQHRQNLRLHRAREDAAQARHREAMAQARAHHEALEARTVPRER